VGPELVSSNRIKRDAYDIGPNAKYALHSLATIILSG
jgi:hypothetical protein